MLFEHVREVEARDRKARALRQLGRMTEAEAAFEQCVSRAQATVPIDACTLVNGSVPKIKRRQILGV